MIMMMMMMMSKLQVKKCRCKLKSILFVCIGHYSVWFLYLFDTNYFLSA